MSRPAEQELIDWTKWFYEHKDSEMSIQKKFEFLCKTMDGLFAISCQLAADIRMLERRGDVRKDSGGVYGEDDESLIVIPGQGVRHARH